MTTALSATAAPAARTPRGPSGLVWAVLRVHRTALVFLALALAAAVAVLIWMYAIGDEARRGLSACAMPVAADGLPSCASVHAITADDTYRAFIALIAAALSYTVLPVAAWAGGALIGRELENGTARLTWVQSVSPARWLAAKLAVPAVLLTVGIGGLVLLYLSTRQDDPSLAGDWYFPEVYISLGPTAVAHALAGLALGALAGLLCRRALPAAGAGFTAALVLHTVLERFREDLWPTVTRVEKTEFELPRSAWQTHWQSETRVTYHPESHFWPLQYVETGILLAVAAAATVTAFAVLRRRTP
ncbi:hypothetical protein ACWCPI_37180 [Streptomyces sp. NPDC001920]